MSILGSGSPSSLLGPAVGVAVSFSLRVRDSRGLLVIAWYSGS